MCTLCCQFLWIVCFVCLRLLSCVPYVASFSGLFVLSLVFVVYFHVYPMLPVSLDCLFCLSSSFILCTICCQFLWIVCFVCLRLLSCVPYVASFSGLFVLFVFVFYHVYLMLPVSLDCLFCLSSSFILCTICCQFLWIVCFVCLRLLSCVPYVASFSGLFVLFVFVFYLVYHMLPVSLDCLFCLSSSFILCTICCQFLWIVCFVCLRLMCVPYVASFSGLFVLFVFVFYHVYLMLPVSLDCLFCLSSSFILCTICCQFLWIVCFVCLRLLSCVPYVASFSGLFVLFVFVFYLVYHMLPVSLDCLFCLSSSFIMCTLCCQFLWIVCFDVCIAIGDQLSGGDLMYMLNPATSAVCSMSGIVIPSEYFQIQRWRQNEILLNANIMARISYIWCPLCTRSTRLVEFSYC